MFRSPSLLWSLGEHQRLCLSHMNLDTLFYLCTIYKIHMAPGITRDHLKGKSVDLLRGYAVQKNGAPALEAEAAKSELDSIAEFKLPASLQDTALKSVQ